MFTLHCSRESYVTEKNVAQRRISTLSHTKSLEARKTRRARLFDGIVLVVRDREKYSATPYFDAYKFLRLEDEDFAPYIIPNKDNAGHNDFRKPLRPRRTQQFGDAK